MGAHVTKIAESAPKNVVTVVWYGSLRRQVGRTDGKVGDKTLHVVFPAGNDVGISAGGWHPGGTLDLTYSGPSSKGADYETPKMPGTLNGKLVNVQVGDR